MWTWSLEIWMLMSQIVEQMLRRRWSDENRADKWITAEAFQFFLYLTANILSEV